MALFQFHIPILVHGTKIESKEFVYSIKMIQEHFFHSNNLNLIVHTCNKMGSFCRDKIQCIDELLTLGSLKIMKLSQTRANYVNLHNKVSIMSIFMLRKFCIDCWTYVQWFSQWVNGWYVSIQWLQLKLMATVHQTQPTIQLLLSTQEFVGALDLISTTQEVLTQELAGVHSFR